MISSSVSARAARLSLPHAAEPMLASRGARLPRRFGGNLAIVLSAAAVWLIGAAPLFAQTNGIWSDTTSGGIWSTAINWQSGNIARGAGASADFSQLTMTNNNTVHLDTARTIGSMIFGDVGNTYNWTLDNNGTNSHILTMQSGNGGLIGAPLSGAPSIAVTNGTATVSAVITGTGGLVVNPGGQTGTLVLTGANTYYDAPVGGTPPNGGYGAITVDAGTLSIASDVAPGTYLFANASPLGYLPPGTAGFPVSGASFEPADIWLNGGALQATATFVLSPFRGIALGAASGGGGGTINVTGGSTLTYGDDTVLDPTEAIRGVLSDYNIGSSLTLTGGGTLFLNSVNSYTGATNINGAGVTLQVGIANAISRFSGVSVASTATLWLNGFSQSVGSLAGAGSITDNSNTGTNITLTVGGDNTSPTFSGVLSNTTAANTNIISLLTKGGSGNQTLSTSTGAVWATTGNGGGYDLAGPSSGMAPVVAVVGGTLTLDLSHATTQTNLVNPYYALQLGGGTLALSEAASSSASSQSFNGTTVNTGASAVVVATNGNSSSTGFLLGNIARNSGGTVDFNPSSATAGSINTTNAPTSFLGGWATVAGADWAGINGSGNIVGLSFAGGSYTGDNWTGSSNTNVTQNDSINGATTNSLRFNVAGPASGGFSVTFNGANTITSGGILVTSAVGANGATLAGGGSLTSGNGTDLIVQQFDSAGSLTISAPIAGSVGLTKSGPGTLVLSGASTYTGATTINGGVVSISTDAVGNNAAAPLGSTQSAATPGDIVIDGGTLLASGSPGNAFTLNANRGIALGPANGIGGGTISVAAANTMTVAGIIANDGTSISSLTKTGPGTLILTGSNTFGGGIFMNQGTLVAIKAASLAGANNGPITFTGNATIQYSGTGLFSTPQMIIDSGATATIDNIAGVGGAGTWRAPFAIRGQGGLNIISSTGSIAASIIFDQSDLSTNSTYTGPTTIYAAAYEMPWSGIVNNEPAPTRLDPSNVLNLGGRVLYTFSGAGQNAEQTDVLASYINLIADTSSQLAGSGVGGTMNGTSTIITINSVSSNGIVRNSGSTLDVELSEGYFVANAAVANTAAGNIGGWATFGGTDWAAVGGDNSLAQYSGYVNDTWAALNNTTVTLASNSVPASSTTNTLRFVSLTTTSGSSLSQTVTLSGANVIASGGILVTTNVSTNGAGTDNSTFTITGGSLTSGDGADLIVNQFNSLSGSSLTIASQITNNGSTSIGLTLGGNDAALGGTLILTNPSNSYTGATAINAGTTLLAGAANVIPSTSAVIVSKVGTFNLNGFNQSVGSLANFNGSLATLAGINIGYGTTVTAGTSFGSGTNVIVLTVGNDNTSTTFNGALIDGNANNQLALDKVGSGTLTLGNFNDNVTSGTANLTNYSGGTVITAGTLDIVYDADFGAVPGSPTTNITFNGNVGTPTLQFNAIYMGTSLSANRSIVVNSGDVGYMDTNGNPLITYAGLVTVGSGGTFGKTGAGVFELDAPPNLGNSSNLAVTGGTLRLNYGSAATIGTSATASVSSGATLELAGSVSQLSQNVNIGNNGTLLVSSATNQNVGAVTGAGNTVVNTGGSLTAYQIRQNSLTISGTATVTLLPSGSGSTTNPANPNNINFSSSLTSLSIGGAMNAWTGTLDIGNNGLVIAYGSGTDPYATIDNLIESGYNGGIWGGTGITSSLAQAAIHAPHPLNIGLLDFTPGSGNYSSTTFLVFAGQTVTTNAILVRLTYMDDLVLSGDMSQNDATSDALLFAANYGVGTTWGVGNVTHDGLIDSNDALLFAANYAVGLPSLDGTTGNAVALGGNAAVPEPASVVLAATGVIALLGFFRRRQQGRAGSIAELVK